MSEDHRESLMREAADIFLQLRDDPRNPELQARRDAFCARGQAENDAYHELVKTWKASGVMQAPKRLRSIILFLCGFLGASYFAYEPIRISILADLATTSIPIQATLASGDVVLLDADSALIDDTTGKERDVALLEGAAFFDVEVDEVPFNVVIGEVTVSVVGTSFEAAFLDDTVIVSVFEGRVNVSSDNEMWELSAGDHFSWKENRTANVEQRSTTDIATWRGDRLIVDGMTLGQAAAIIERRLAGPVVFTNQRLRRTRVTGTLDLSDPLLALRLLAETGGGQVFHAPGVGRIIASR